jgi:hypothetical protein
LGELRQVSRACPASCAAYHRDALEAYQGSLKIFAEIGGGAERGDPASQHWRRLRLQGACEQAPAARRRALVIYREVGDLPNRMNALNGIGASYRVAGRSANPRCKIRIKLSASRLPHALHADPQL